MNRKYIKEEEKIIVGKKVKIKTLHNLLIAKARNNNIIEVSENLKKYLGKRGYEYILLHERGHLEPINSFLSNFPSIIFVLSILYFTFNILNKTNIFRGLFFYLWLIPSLFLLQTICYWIIEILADRFAIINSNTPENYEKVLNKVYGHLGYLGNNSWLYRNYYHPPKYIRFWFIRKFIEENLG